MKLIFDGTELSYFNEKSGHRAGVFYVALNLIKAFEKAGVDITFYCDFRRYYFMKDIEEFKDIPLIEEHSMLNKFFGYLLYKSDNLNVRVKHALLILSRFYEKYINRANLVDVKNIEKFDAYFSPFTPPSKNIEEANIKKFRMIHDIIPILEKGISTSPINWYYKIYSTINNRDFYLTNSEYTRKDVLKYFPFIDESHIKTTLLAANEKFYPEKSDSDKYIFSLCTLGKRKNLLFGIKNFFKFIEKYNISDLKLVLGGSVWKRFEKELERELDKYDRSKIELSGYIEEDDLRKYYSNALCFIYPSLYEGFGLPVLEAMQCGCPVITSNRSSLPEVIGDCGIVVNPYSDDEMQDALRKMYFDENFRAKCTEDGLQRAKTFSWEKCANGILDFIKDNSFS